MARADKALDIRSGLLFPFPFLILGAGFVLAGIGIFGSHPLVSVVLVPVGLFMVTSFEGTEINISKRTYREYSSYFFIRKGRPKSFESVEKVYITSAKVSQTMYTAHTTSSSTFSNTEYRAYVKFNAGEKVLLFSGRNKKRMLARANDVAQSLNTLVHDNSVRVQNL